MRCEALPDEPYGQLLPTADQVRAAGVYGAEIEDAIRLYQPLCSFYNADNFGHNPGIYAKCVEAITDAGLE